MKQMKVLFVCSGNAYRSPLAEVLLKKLRPDLEVESAGTEIAGRISEEAKEYSMKEKAEQYLKSGPESLNKKDLRQYDLIIAMEQKHKDSVLRRCPECENKVTVWNIPDLVSVAPEYTEEINKKIKGRVTDLAGADLLFL
jgi:protein-tyrosine-phosphatase